MIHLNRSAGVEETRESHASEEPNDSEREIGRLAIAKHHARRAVENWISEEGGLSQADQAPGWRVYMAARRALSEALNALPSPPDKLRGDE
jgi:hypothetical protein